MNRQRKHQGLIDLGAARVETKGGPWGADDHRGSLMTYEAGLKPD
jgi:hypothetical protein